MLTIWGEIIKQKYDKCKVNVETKFCGHIDAVFCLIIDNRLSPSSEPKMVYCQLDPKEHIAMPFYLKFKSFHSIQEKVHENIVCKYGDNLASASTC